MCNCLHVLFFCSKDKPEDLGFPPVEPAAEKPKAEGEAKPKPNVLKQLLNNVLKNPFIWGMALTYFFIYIVRQVRGGLPGGGGESQRGWVNIQACVAHIRPCEAHVHSKAST
jgi:hypothetical protein